jgi:hypothetical protein
MHDRIRLLLSAAGIAVVTLLASGRPLPFSHAGTQAKAPISAAAQATGLAPVSAEIPVISEAPKLQEPELRVPRIRRTAGADVTQA